MLTLTVLGSGDASGIPRSDCSDPTCACAQARRGSGTLRGNSCALVTGGGTRVAIDTGCGSQPCEALLLTHYHPDHAGFAGTFAPCRAFGPHDGVPSPLPAELVPNEDVFPAPRISGLDLTQVDGFAEVMIGALRCTALPLNHPIPVHGWAVEYAGKRLAWLTDTYGIPAATLGWLADHPCDVLALDTTFAPGVQRAPLKGHGDVSTSLAAIAASGARRGLLIHIGHGMQNWLNLNAASLPTTIEVAHDGLTLNL